MPPTNIKLFYFNGRGRAEVSRWVLAQAGADYEDIRLQGEEWQKKKPEIPTGQMPYLETDDIRLPQSTSIAFYLAREFGLAGNNSVQMAQVHMVCACVEDAVNAFVKARFAKSDDEKAAGQKAFGEVAIPRLVTVLERMLTGNWLVGDKVSLADLTVACFLSDVDEELYKSSAKVVDLVARVKDLPNIKRWISERPETNF